MSYKPLLIKTALLFAVLICCICTNAQTYNNWLLDGESILNFNTNPPTLDKINRDYFRGYFSLSDNNGKLILHGGRIIEDPKKYVIKNNKNKTLVSFPIFSLIKVTGCKSTHSEGYYYVAIISSSREHFKSFSMRLYQFDSNGTLKDSIITNELNYSQLALFMPQDNGEVIFLAHKHKENVIDTYNLSNNIIKKTHSCKVELPNFNFSSGIFSFDDILPVKDGSKIICLLGGIGFIIECDITAGKYSLYKELNIPFQNTLTNIALSNNDKYLIINNNDKIIRYKMSEDFEFEKGEIIYKMENNVNCTDIQTGIDGNLYMIQNDTQKKESTVKCFYNIENDNITVETIGNISYGNHYFPTIPRIIEAKSVPCGEIQKTKIICE